MIALLLVLLLTAGAGVGSWCWLSGRFTTVPAMASMNEAKAREALSANDLEVATASEYSETVPNGIIIRTDPTSGDRLLRGSSVTIVVSKGAERYPMPPVVGTVATRSSMSRGPKRRNLILPSWGLRRSEMSRSHMILMRVTSGAR